MGRNLQPMADSDTAKGALPLESGKRTHHGLPLVVERLPFRSVPEHSQLSVFGVYRVPQRAGLVKRRRSRPRRKPQSYAMAVPGQRVQVDVKYLPLLRLRDRPEPLQQYLYTAIDDCARFQVASVSHELTPQASVRFLQHLLRAYPFPTWEVQIAHGAGFTYVFFPHVQKLHSFSAYRSVTHV